MTALIIVMHTLKNAQKMLSNASLRLKMLMNMIITKMSAYLRT